MSPLILAIETASERCSVALHSQGKLYSVESEQPRGHADLILSMVQNVLEQSEVELQQLDALAYSKGPGAFTSIRIGISVVQGLALGANLPVIGASSLEVMAHKFRHDEGRIILPALDARMNEVYFGAYVIKAKRAIPLQADQVAKPEYIKLMENLHITQALSVGSGWQVYHEEMNSRFNQIDLSHNPECYPHAIDLVDIAYAQYQANDLLTADQVLPVYIRDNVTHGS